MLAVPADETCRAPSPPGLDRVVEMEFVVADRESTGLDELAANRACLWTKERRWVLGDSRSDFFTGCCFGGGGLDTVDAAPRGPGPALAADG